MEWYVIGTVRAQDEGVAMSKFYAGNYKKY
jgi:hypothetical protein